MINVEQRKALGNFRSSQQEAIHKIREIGQLKCVKLQVSYLLDSIDKKCTLTPSLRKPLEANLVLQTTSTKVLAAYLHRLCATENEGCLRSQVSSK